MNEVLARQLDLLIVDDSAVDAELIADALTRAGLHFDLRRVDDEAGLRHALDTARPDAILADWTMPRFSGRAALAIARERDADVPVIFVTATMPVGSLADMLRSGAVDYVFKQELSTLGLVVSRAIVEAERRVELMRTVAQLQEANARIKLAQEQLVQSEKMAALGQLAAGIAHELNSPLAYVKANMEVLGDYLDALLRINDAYRRGLDASGLERDHNIEVMRADAPDLIAQSLEGVERARRIVFDLKGFSRRDDAGEWQQEDVNGLLESALTLVWNELKYKCTVHREYGELPRVRCLPDRVHQVFVNLLLNAGQAIVERGSIVVHSAARNGHVTIEIRDTGVGIAPEDLPRIFEPFFTTKPKGVGTGLGLAISANIIAQHGGRIEGASAHGGGTTFRVTLPVNGPADPAAAVA